MEDNLYDIFYWLQVRTVSAKYIMKGDDDTFVRVDAVLKEANKIAEGRSLYVGNINYYHKPLRYGKWAVTYEVPFSTSSVLFLYSVIICFCYHVDKYINFTFSNSVSKCMPYWAKFFI